MPTLRNCQEASVATAEGKGVSMSKIRAAVRDPKMGVLVDHCADFIFYSESDKKSD